MRLDTLKPAEGSRKAAVRVGRGIGSGLGKTCGRGVKGAGARKSVWVRVPLSLPGSCEHKRQKTLSHSKSRRMHMAPVGANMAHWESWLIRLPVTQKITGSSPVWVAIAPIGVVHIWLPRR